MTGRLLLLFALLAPALAEDAPAPDSLGRPAGRTEPVDSVSLLPHKNPGTAVLLSLLIPGGGQIYTANYWKAPFIAAAEIGLAGLALREHSFCSRLLKMEPVDTAVYRIHRDRRTAFIWWAAGVTVFSMADAYVSAQLYAFDRQMRLTLRPDRLGIEVPLAAVPRSEPDMKPQ
ncbi:MAG: DUF5683 domain-containing protein [candidate division WOR-3 bacterium]